VRVYDPLLQPNAVSDTVISGWLTDIRICLDYGAALDSQGKAPWISY